ncbi:hypothetical protein DEA8626_03420 [Defluviimonas aquaemixtae]|uniref:4-amino-4-deoxy-L-arabinose-phosphoundecaprenol flippase subunit ArnF n=1 Tax=Albidovulum aquaemixtae TaxID=1542388 RepID=A0A2R8BLV5_9RHOB|nr:hypothetical protein [Defluviimonas aquaemixtae]SPH24369.1 hypothetical protein DEA8626_03420 [Defluviimonas aquaemixtae]
MLSMFYGYAFAFLTALIVIAGDVSLKHAADTGLPLNSRPAVLGALLYALSGVLWYFAMRHVTLAQGGVAYSMFTLLAICLIGATHFGEQIRAREVAGIGCALLSMVLLIRVQG